MRLHLLAALACTALCTGPSPIVIETPMAMEEAAPSRAKRRVEAAQAQRRYKRSRGAQAKPRRRSNRLTISRRARRKHRRAA